jgi:O-antigen ligase
MLGLAAVFVAAVGGAATLAVGPAAAIGLAVAAAGFAVLLATRWEVAALLLALSFFVARGPVQVGSGVYTPLVWGSVALVIAAALTRRATLNALGSRDVRIAILLLAAWVTLLGISSLGSPVPAHSFLITGLFVVFLAFLVACVATASAPSPERLAVVLVAVSAGGGAILLARLAASGDLSTIWSFQELSSAKETSTATIGNLNSYGYVVMLGAPIATAFLLESRSALRSAALIVSLAVIAVALLATVSRSAMIGAVCGTLVTILLLRRRSPGRVAAIVLPCVAVVGYLALASNTFSSGGLGYASEGYHGRSALWALAVDLWKQAPILGHGPGSWDALVGGRGGEAHNQVLSALVGGGILTLALEIAIVVFIIRAGIRATRSLAPSEPGLIAAAAGATGAFVAIITRGAFESSGPFDMRHWFTILGWAVMALVLAACVRTEINGA